MKAIAAVIDVVLALTGAVLLLFPVLPVWRHGWFAEPGSIMLRSQFPNGVPSMPSEHPSDRMLVFTDVVSAAAASGQDTGLRAIANERANAVVPASADPLLSDSYALFLIFSMAAAEVVVLVWRWLVEHYLRVALYSERSSGSRLKSRAKEFPLLTRLACGADACESALYAAMTIVQITFLAAIVVSLLLVPLLDPPGKASGVATYDQILNANVLKNQFGDADTSAAYNISRWKVGFPYYCCCYRERGLAGSALVTNNGCSAASDGDGWVTRDGAASWCTEDAFAAATVETTLYWLTACDATSSTCSDSVAAMCAVPRGAPNGNAWDGTNLNDWAFAQGLFIVVGACFIAFFFCVQLMPVNVFVCWKLDVVARCASRRTKELSAGEGTEVPQLHPSATPPLALQTAPPRAQEQLQLDVTVPPQTSEQPQIASFGVAIPPGAAPGTLLQVMAPNGFVVHISVPPGATPGTILHASVPDGV
jgi:hypothetical protein